MSDDDQKPQDDQKPEGDKPEDKGTPAPEQVTVDKAEWNRVNAALRKLTKAQREADKGTPEPKPAEQKPEDKGTDPNAKRLEKLEQELQQERAARREERIRGAFTEELTGRGYTAKQAQAMAKLADLSSVEVAKDNSVDSESLGEVADAITADYADVFTKPAPKPKDGEGDKDKRRRQSGPASSKADQSKRPEGYISPEEYAETPLAVRYSDAFRKRVEISRPYWPKDVRASDF